MVWWEIEKNNPNYCFWREQRGDMTKLFNKSQLPKESVPYPLSNQKIWKAIWLNPCFRNIIPYMSVVGQEKNTVQAGRSIWKRREAYGIRVLVKIKNIKVGFNIILGMHIKNFQDENKLLNENQQQFCCSNFINQVRKN